MIYYINLLFICLWLVYDCLWANNTIGNNVILQLGTSTVVSTIRETNACHSHSKICVNMFQRKMKKKSADTVTVFWRLVKVIVII